MIAKVAYVAEQCPFQLLQLAPASAATRIALCIALEPNFWEPAAPYVLARLSRFFKKPLVFGPFS